MLEALKSNPFGWFRAKGKQARLELMEKLCPLTLLPQAPFDIPYLEAQFPPSSDYSEVENAFELLAIAIINEARRQWLGCPSYLAQEVGGTVLLHPQPSQFDWNDSDIKGELVAQWPSAQLRLDKHIRWQSGGAAIVQNWQLYSHQLRQIATKAIFTFDRVLAN